MVTTKHFHNIEELQQVQYLATQCPQDVGLHSEDGSGIVDAKSFIGLFALDFSKPVMVVSEDLAFHKKIADIGETLEFMPESLKDQIYKYGSMQIRRTNVVRRISCFASQDRAAPAGAARCLFGVHFAVVFCRWRYQAKL